MATPVLFGWPRNPDGLGGCLCGQSAIRRTQRLFTHRVAYRLARSSVRPPLRPAYLSRHALLISGRARVSQPSVRLTPSRRCSCMY